jgi:hypothetical protein
MVSWDRPGRERQRGGFLFAVVERGELLLLLRLLPFKAMLLSECARG